MSFGSRKPKRAGKPKSWGVPLQGGVYFCGANFMPAELVIELAEFMRDGFDSRHASIRPNADKDVELTLYDMNTMRRYNNDKPLMAENLMIEVTRLWTIKVSELATALGCDVSSPQLTLRKMYGKSNEDWHFDGTKYHVVIISLSEPVHHTELKPLAKTQDECEAPTVVDICPSENIGSFVYFSPGICHRAPTLEFRGEDDIRSIAMFQFKFTKNGETYSPESGEEMLALSKVFSRQIRRSRGVGDQMSLTV